MAKSPKRTASFKYCSRKRKPGCQKASKKCSYKKSRTPKCQPKKSKTPKKTTKPKSAKKSKTLEVAKKFSKKGPRQLKSDKYKACSAKKSKNSCKPIKYSKDGKKVLSGKTDPKLECAWDPKKNPKCMTKAPSIFDVSLEFHSDKAKLHFTYPVTREGVEACFFVVHKVGEVNKLYLRYSKALLASMKTKHANALKLWWCSFGEMIAEKKLKTEKKADVAHRIGVPKTLSAAQLDELTPLLKDCNDEEPDIVDDDDDASSASSSSEISEASPPPRTGIGGILPRVSLSAPTRREPSGRAAPKNYAGQARAENDLSTTDDTDRYTLQIM
tara:strand:- start:3352 stop:4335 length:984 start_codon:yes stop_codon:yes gene_type:complete